MLEENGKLKKEWKDGITKNNKETNNLKEEIKILNKKRVKQSFSIYVIDILSEGINEQDLIENLQEKQDLQGINIRNDRMGKEGNTAVFLIGAEELAEKEIG